jgi:hypothetical protein
MFDESVLIAPDPRLRVGKQVMQGIFYCDKVKFWRLRGGI